MAKHSKTSRRARTQRRGRGRARGRSQRGGANKTLSRSYPDPIPVNYRVI